MGAKRGKRQFSPTSFAHLMACNMICSAACSPRSALANSENCIARQAKGSVTILMSSADNVLVSAATFSVSRSHKAHFRAETTRQMYLSSRGRAARAASYGSASCPPIWALSKFRYGLIFSERTSSCAPVSVLISFIGTIFGVFSFIMKLLIV
jgi:hypothetical protein